MLCQVALLLAICHRLWIIIPFVDDIRTTSKAIDIAQACDYSAGVARRGTAEVDAHAFLECEALATTIGTQG